MVHEYKHLLQNKKSYHAFDELQAILFQVNHSSWKNITEAQKIDVRNYAKSNYNEVIKHPTIYSNEKWKIWAQKI